MSEFRKSKLIVSELQISKAKMRSYVILLIGLVILSICVSRSVVVADHLCSVGADDNRSCKVDCLTRTGIHMGYCNKNNDCICTDGPTG